MCQLKLQLITAFLLADSSCDFNMIQARLARFCFGLLIYNREAVTHMRRQAFCMGSIDSTTPAAELRVGKCIVAGLPGYAQACAQ